MELPKIEQPIFQIEVPSLKKKVPFRPFLVKEEKLLLMAKDSGEDADILSSVKQVITNCCLDPTISISKLAIFDLEYLFVKLRMNSVDNIIKMTYTDLEDEKDYDFSIDLNEVKIVFPENSDNVIKITSDSGITMKYPGAELYDDRDFLEIQDEYLFNLMIKCIENIYVKDSIYEAKEYKKEQLQEFLENLDLKTFEKMKKFLDATPSLNYEINYKNSLGNDRKIVLRSLNDFFMLG